MAVSKEFAKTMGRNKENLNRFNKSKGARPNDFGPPDIEDGLYIARVTAEAGKTPNKGVPYVRFRWMVLEGEFAKTAYWEDYYLEGADEDRVQKSWDGLSKAIQVLSGLQDEDMDNFEKWTIADLCEVLDEIDSEAPKCKIRVRNWTSDKTGKSGVSCYFVSLVDEQPSDSKKASDDDDGSSEDDSQSDSDDDGSDNGDDDPQTDDSQDVEIEKDDIVLYKPRGSREEIECKVTSSNKAKQECSLKEVDGTKIYSNVAWEKVSLPLDD
jgi:hypothetical protein